MLLVVGRYDVTVEVALRGISTPLAVTEWRRLPVKVRQALPTADDLSATVTRTVREIESAADTALSPVRTMAGSRSRMVLLRARSGAAIDEWGEAVEQALKPELEQVLQIEVVVGGGDAFEDGEAAGLHD
jgi:hypothetical protein